MYFRAERDNLYHGIDTVPVKSFIVPFTDDRVKRSSRVPLLSIQYEEFSSSTPRLPTSRLISIFESRTKKQPFSLVFVWTHLHYCSAANWRRTTVLSTHCTIVPLLRRSKNRRPSIVTHAKTSGSDEFPHTSESVVRVDKITGNNIYTLPRLTSVPVARS